MRRLLLILTPLLVLSLLLAAVGCGEEEVTPTPTPAPTATPTPTPVVATPTPTPTMWAQPEFKPKMVHTYPPTSPDGRAAQYLADQIYEKTNGRVKVEVFPAASLFGGPDGVDALMMGVIQMNFLPEYYLEPRVAELGIFTISGIWEGYEHTLRWMVHPDGAYALLPYLERLGIKGLAFWPVHQTALLATKNKELKSLEDTRGLRSMARGTGSKAVIQEYYGRRPVAIPYIETPSALETGLIDMMESSVSSAVGFRIQDIAKHVLVYERDPSYPVVAFNLNWWNSLPADVRDIIEKVAREGVYWAHKQMVKNEAEAKEIFRQKMVTYHELTKEQREEMVKLLEPLYAPYMLNIEQGSLEVQRQVRPSRMSTDEYLEMMKGRMSAEEFQLLKETLGR